MQGIEQSGRLAVVGEMAAHLAHEVRTPLSSIKMNLQLLQRAARKGAVPSDARLSIDTSLSELVRLEAAVSRMLEFGSPERGTRSRCSLHELIGEATDLLRSVCEKQGIALHLALTAESDWIWADQGRVKGVFLNLLVNARDAMPDGGEILIETQLLLGDAGQQMIGVAVSDSGPGVPVGLREEVFHPFFTTKNEGSGIGLPAALRTLREHGGDLYLSERPDGGSGACFVALLPLALSEQGETPSVSSPDPKWPATARSWRRTPRESLPWKRLSEISLPGGEEPPRGDAHPAH
jgi:two-component system NtrC family sensor kinase